MYKYLLFWLAIHYPILWSQTSNEIIRLFVQQQIVLQIGAPINSVAIKTHLHLVNQHVEFGAGTQTKLFFSGLGPKGTFFENRLQLDAKVVWGQYVESNPMFLHAMFNRSNKSNSLCYAYYWYWDTRRTSQASGAWSMELRNYFVYFENDLFAGQGRDRFRTGSLQILFREPKQIWGIKARIWTGETANAPILDNKTHPTAKPYKNLSSTLYGKYSNGILSISYHNAQGFQPIGAEIGIDDERIRHFLQNKIVHDFPYSKQKKIDRNKYIPMLDREGLPFIDDSTQKLRRPKIVLQASWGFWSD
jgi:hypothetical protein